jgi:quinol monooxygenase YgiN
VLLVTGFMRLRGADIARMQGPISRQAAAVREFHGCEHYAFGNDLLEADVLRVSERWRSRTAQSAHLIGDHMVDFNIAMRAASVVGTEVESYEDGIVRRLLQIPATSFRPEREERSMVIVMGQIKFASGEIERLRLELGAMIIATRVEDGCQLYAFSRDVIDPDTLHIAERWRDRAALEAHFATPHMATFNAALETAKVESVVVQAYDAAGEWVLRER